MHDVEDEEEEDLDRARPSIDVSVERTTVGRLGSSHAMRKFSDRIKNGQLHCVRPEKVYSV